jgi:hypothetical protein
VRSAVLREVVSEDTLELARLRQPMMAGDALHLVGSVVRVLDVGDVIAIHDVDHLKHLARGDLRFLLVGRKVHRLIGILHMAVLAACSQGERKSAHGSLQVAFGNILWENF